MTSPKALFAGLSTYDLEYVCESYPVEDAKVVAERMFTMAGGPALNASVTFSALGGRAELFSSIGKGPPASAAIEELKRYHVSLIDASPDDEDVLATSTIIINSLTGSRTIVTYQPKSNRPSKREFEFNERPDVLLIDGYLPDLVEPIARWAKARSIPVVLDGDTWKPWMPRLLPLVDIAIVSESFHPTGKFLEPSDMQSILKCGVRKIAVTRGPRAIWWCDGEDSGQLSPPPVAAIDTLGAGDIFHGAFCYYYSLIKNFGDALSSASKIATQSCTSWGTRSWISHLPSRL